VALKEGDSRVPLEVDQRLAVAAHHAVFRGSGVVPGIAPWHTSKASALPYPIGS